MLALPITVLTGMAFAVLIFAFSAKQEGDGGFNILFRFIMTPLWHGVDANRSLALGSPDVAAVLGHTAYLLVVIAVGGWFARRAFTKRLVV